MMTVDSIILALWKKLLTVNGPDRVFSSVVDPGATTGDGASVWCGDSQSAFGSHPVAEQVHRFTGSE